MKKTLVALAITAFAASASAVTVYDNEGSKIDFDGSLRLAIEKNHTKTKGAESETGHSYLKNNGSRFGVRTNHAIGENGLFALSRLEFRFDGENAKSQSDAFGDIYALRAYVGLGHKEYGEVTFGRQVTIADDISQADKSYLYGDNTGALTTAGNSVVRYDYKGIEGLQVGVNYNFGTERDANKEIQGGKIKAGYGAGVTYKFAVGEGQSVKVAAGYTRDNYASADEVTKGYTYVDANDLDAQGRPLVKTVADTVTRTKGKHYKDGWAVGLGYEVGALSLGLDGGQSYEKKNGNTIRHSRVSFGASYAVTDSNNVFGGYYYTHGRDKAANTTSRTHNYYLGTDYKLHKHVVTFVETGVQKAKSTTGYSIGAGLRVFW